MTLLVIFAFLALGQQMPPTPPTIPQRVEREGSIRIVYSGDGIARNAQRIIDEGDLIFVGRIVHKVSLLSTDQRAVVTDETVEVEDVLHSRNRATQRGDKIRLRHIGGALSIGSATVEEVDEELPGLTKGELYLFVARKYPDAYWLTQSAILALRDDTSVCVNKYPQGFSEFCGKSKSEVLHKIKSLILTKRK